MIRGLYTAASAMMAQMIQTDTMANNLANLSTAGFKRSSINFQSLHEDVISRFNGFDATPIGKISTGILAGSASQDFSQGTMIPTGNVLDMAIQGEGLFTLQDDAGKVSYTRNGSFHLNDNNQLVAQNGERVLDTQNQPITVPKTSKTIETDRFGTIQVDNTKIAKIKVTQFNDPRLLERVGSNRYELRKEFSEDGNVKVQAGEYKIFQGNIENSNVNVVSELVKNVEGLRMYEALQKNIHFQNETLGKAINEAGRTG